MFCRVRGKKDFLTRRDRGEEVSRKRRWFARAGELFGINLNALRRRLVEKDEYQGVAGLGHCIAALARYLSGYAACILRNHLAEAIALDGNLLSGFDLVVEFDQMLNEPARG